VLGVGEGLETTDAGMQMFGVPGWATLSAGGMRKFGFWLMANPKAVRRLLVFADAGTTGEGAATELCALATSVGISTEVHLPRGGDDLADDMAKGLGSKEPGPSAAVLVRPIIIVTGGQLAQIIDAAEAALVASDHELFQRNGLIVYPVVSHHIPIADKSKTSGLRLVRLRANHLIERFTYWADFRKRNAKGALIPIDCPPKIANAYLERNIWGLRCLTGITTCPTLRPDGSILDTRGYDEKTGILYRPQGITFPEIPIEPTRDEAVTALGKLRSLIREFPFVDEASRSVALSGILTTVIRRSIDRAPLHAFTAPDVGTGKSKLVDVAAMIGMGHEAPVIAFTDDDAEMQKRLGACLIAGDTIISIDNVDKDLSSSFLCQCLTQDIVKPRILGKSEQPDISPNAVYFTTGNNLRLADDLAARRTIRGALDAKCERPDLRTFETPDPIVVLRRDRPQYLAAALTVLRAYVVANTPRRPGPTGSFDEWSNWVRAALIWLDQADPWATTETVRRLDPKRDALIAVITEWSRAIGIVEELTVRQLIDRVTDFVPTQGVQSQLVTTRVRVPGISRSPARRRRKERRYRRISPWKLARSPKR